MISDSWFLNILAGILLASTATGILIELRSSSLIPKSLILWPLGFTVFGTLTAIQGWLSLGFSVFFLLGLILIFCGIQALLVNIRKIQPWPSGVIWLALILVGIGFQFYPLFLQRMTGLIWATLGVAKLIRERGAVLEGGSPLWVQLLYLQAFLLAVYR